MDFDIHEDARTEGVALRRGPFSHGRIGREGRERGGRGDGYGKGGAVGAVMRFAWVTDGGGQG
jgi:hypothetical protein